MATATQAVSGLHVLDSNVDAEASTTTSPLSEVEDKDGLPDEMEDVVLGNDKPHIHDDDSDSNLSDAGNDTEAETERMFDTPQIQRHKSVILDQFNRDHIIEKTPTRPSERTVKLPMVGSDLDDSYASDGPPHSSLPSVASKLANHQKRKRSPDIDLSESGQPNLKRSISGTLNGKIDAHNSTLRITIDPANLSNGIHGRDSNEVSSKDSKRLNGIKSRYRFVDRHDDDVGAEDDTEARNNHDGDIDEEAEAVLRNEEEQKKRIALEEWDAIEARFVTFRDRLYKDRLEKLEKEEQSLLADEPYHPEYLAMMQCIDERYEKKMKHINKQYEYVLKAQEQVAVSTRTQIWSHFYQSMREKREEFLEILHRDWYDTQLARRRAHSIPDVAIMFPANPAQQTRNAVAYNTEVSILSGMAKHLGFPAVPHMHGASETEIEDDFNAMKNIMYEAQTQYDLVHATAMHTQSQSITGRPAASRGRSKTSKSSAHQMMQTSTAEDAAAAAVLSAPMTMVAPMPGPPAIVFAPRSNSTAPQNAVGNRRANQPRAKDGPSDQGSSKSRLSNHVSNGVMSPPLRPSVDATRV